VRQARPGDGGALRIFLAPRMPTERIILNGTVAAPALAAEGWRQPAERGRARVDR
jgi:hypothetical protein